MPTKIKETDNQPRVFTVIVTFNGESWISRCIDSLKKSYYPCEIVVIDNYSIDKTIEILQKYSHLHIMKEVKNHGFGIANNIGISFALQNKADYIFLLNQDAFVNENTISNLVATAEKDTSFGLYSPIHLNEAGDNFDNNFLKNYVIDSAPKYLADLCIKGKTKSTYPIHSINAAAWFIRNSTFKIVGGFDPIFFMYGEDNDFSNRLKFHQIKCAIVPQSFIHHSRGKNSQKNTALWRSINARAKRIRSNALAKIKNPNKKLAKNTLSCFVNLLFSAINELFYCLNIKESLSHILAIIYLLFMFHKIKKHRKICIKSEIPWLKNNR